MIRPFQRLSQKAASFNYQGNNSPGTPKNAKKYEKRLSQKAKTASCTG
jgi:hypothetical protein